MRSIEASTDISATPERVWEMGRGAPRVRLLDPA
jgi:hypothetical protein